MRNTYEYEGKVYRIVPDKERADKSRSPCAQCAFNDRAGCWTDVAYVNCLAGVYHYVLADSKEQA